MLVRWNAKNDRLRKMVRLRVNVKLDQPCNQTTNPKPSISGFNMVVGILLQVVVEEEEEEEEECCCYYCSCC